jgi:hypothetical protein
VKLGGRKDQWGAIPVHRTFEFLEGVEHPLLLRGEVGLGAEFAQPEVDSERLHDVPGEDGILGADPDPPRSIGLDAVDPLVPESPQPNLEPAGILAALRHLDLRREHEALVEPEGEALGPLRHLGPKAKLRSGPRLTKVMGQCSAGVMTEKRGGQTGGRKSFSGTRLSRFLRIWRGSFAPAVNAFESLAIPRLRFK